VGSSSKYSRCCTTLPRLIGHLQPRRNWPTWSSIVLITHPVLRICPVGLSHAHWTEKNLNVRHFSSDMEVIADEETWLDLQYSEFLFRGFQETEQRPKKFIELRG